MSWIESAIAQIRSLRYWGPEGANFAALHGLYLSDSFVTGGGRWRCCPRNAIEVEEVEQARLRSVAASDWLCR